MAEVFSFLTAWLAPITCFTAEEAWLARPKGMLLTVGYNIEGFRDRDFGAARNTDKGVFAAVRMTIDADSFSFLGLGR